MREWGTPRSAPRAMGDSTGPQPGSAPRAMGDSTVLQPRPSPRQVSHAVASPKAGQTWDAFFKARDELWAGRAESDKDRQRRENRERQRPQKKSNWFEWREDSPGQFIRHGLTRREAEHAFEVYSEPNQQRYHARSNEWDFAEDFDAPKGRDESTRPKMRASDYDDPEFWEEDYELHPGWISQEPARQGEASTSSKRQRDLEDEEVV